MADRDWMFKTGSSIVAASLSANLSKAEQDKMSGLAWLSSKHRQLMAMPENKATQEFDKLDHKVQQSLQGLFGNTTYNPEELSILGQAGKYAKGFFGGVSDMLSGYAEAINRPIVALSTMDDVGSFSKAWEQAADGKRVFDADRAAKIEKFYGATVSGIAKRISMGDTIGQIVSDLKTDEQFATMEKLLQGDELVLRAIRDYDQAHISYGRAFAHMLNLDPNIGAKSQGLEGSVFKAVSGVTDLASNILFDPATWAAAPIKAYSSATRGLVSLMRAGKGDLTGAQKAFTFLSGGRKKFGFDVAFQDPKIRAAFDEIGSLVKDAAKSNKSTDLMQKAVARQKIQQIMPSLDDNAIEEFITRKVHSADDALKFLNDTESISRILTGKTGSMEAKLPTASAIGGLRKSIREGVGNLTGFNKGMKRLDNAQFKGSFLDDIMQGQSANAALAGRRFNTMGSKVAKMLDRALIEKSAYVGGYDSLGRNMRTRSAGSIYTLARAVFDKADADIIAKSFVGASSDAQARKIVEGLYRTILDNSGISSQENGALIVDRLMNKWNNAIYTEQNAFVSEATAKAIGRSGAANISADAVNGQAMAVAAHHLSHQINLPSFVEIKKQMAQGGKLAWSLGFRDMNQATTDFWSALNLLPRLGIRSVLDEGLFHALTMPVAVFQNTIRGYNATVMERYLANPAGKNDVGLVARHALNHLTKDVSPEDLKLAARDKQFAAQLLETQLTKSMFGKAAFHGKQGENYARYIADNVRFGNTHQIRAVSDSLSKNVATAMPAASDALKTAIEINPNILKTMKAEKVRLGGTPAEITRGGAGFKTNAQMQLVNRVDRNDQVGKIAVAYMEDPAKAVREITKYLKKNKNFYNQFDRANSALTTVESDAASMYLHVRNLFTNSLDEVNTPLLKKIRPNGYGNLDNITAANITADDITETLPGFRDQLFGYSRDVEVYTRFSDYLDEIINRGFEVADRQVATLGREPAFNAYYLHYRTQFDTVEKQYAAELMKKNPLFTQKEASDAAARRFATVSNDLAINRVLGFVDNPHVRSNLAFSFRNMARYYRANEDFYRRAYRVLRENGPQSILRLRLANEGFDHAGFIHEDENGEKFFTFPVDEIMFNAYMMVMGPVMGIETRRPMPMALTGKIKMLTPSLDPESNFPTFAGPFISMAWNSFKKIVPDEFLPAGTKDTVTRTLFGQYAENAGFFDSIIPSSVKRTFTAARALAGYDDAQVASATMKSMAYYAATGNGPEPDWSKAKRDQYLYDVKATARNLVFIRNVLGIFSPVSPQFSTIEDIPAEVLDTGSVSFKQEFQRLVKAESAKGNTDAWNTAILKWTKLNPGRLVYTVSESETSTMAPLRYTKTAVNWVKSNKSFVDKYREAAMFLMPRAEGFDLDAYAYMKREGLQETKDVDKYFEEISNVQVENQYYDVKNKYEDLIANTAYSDVAAGYTANMNAEMKAIKDANPSLRRKLEQFDGTTQLKLDIVGNMSDALDSGLIPESATTRRMRELVSTFNQVYSELNSLTSETDYTSNYKKQLRTNAHQQLMQIAGADPNAKLFYDTILKRLLG